MVRREMLLLCIFVFCTVTAAEAAHTTLRLQDRTLLGAMARSGCHAAWLSVVMRESNIAEDELTRLHAGTPLVMPDGCTYRSPSREDVNVSRHIFAHQAMLRKAREDRTTIALLSDEFTGARAALTAAQGKIEVLEKKNGALQARLQATEQRFPEQPSRDWLLLIGALIGVMVTGVPMFVLGIRPLSNKIKSLNQSMVPHPEASTLSPSLVLSLPEAPPDDAVEYFGEMVKFRDTTIRQVGCPFCSENRIKKDPGNMRRHLDKHPELRVKKISLAEIERLLARPA